MKNSPHLSRRGLLRLWSASVGALLLQPFLSSCQETSPGATPAPELLAGLDGLSVDDFFDQSYRRWLERDPENLSCIGLADLYGVNEGNLTDISDAFIRQTQFLESGTLEILRSYPRATFTPAQNLTAQVYDWFLDDLVRGYAYMYDDYPLNPILTSVHYNLYMLFTAYHPLKSRQDAEDYISRLSQVGTKFTHLMDGLLRRKEHGAILPAFCFPIVLNDLDLLANPAPRQHPYYKAFSDRLGGVSSEERTSLLTRVEQELMGRVIPAYRDLADFMSDLQPHAPQQVGIWQFPEGEAVYAHCLRHQTTLEMSAAEIHALGQEHVERIHAEMRTLFATLGYPASESITNLYNRLASDGGVYRGQEAVAAYEQAIHAAEKPLQEAFDGLPGIPLQVVGGTEGDYYLPAPYDGSRPGIFFVRTNGSTPKYSVKSLAYHETIPGHHMQIALAQEQTWLPALRQGMQFNAYTEGWALYAERLMWELGAYADDIPGDLGRLRMEAFRAARLVVDTGLHAMQWSFERAVQYLVEAAGFPRSEAEREITRYCVWPGQAVSYYIGFQKILDLRQQSRDALGPAFDLKGFHRVVLSNGSLPLGVLESITVALAGSRA